MLPGLRASAIAAISPSTSSAPMAIERALQPNGARTLTGADSSTSTSVPPDAATKATMPRAMRAPTPPHQGQAIVPTRSIRSTGTSA